MKRIVFILVVIGFASLIGWKLYDKISGSTFNGTGARQQPRVAVEIQAVETRNIVDIGTFTGSLKPKSLFLVAPKVSGRLDKIMVNIGDRLEHNQPIAQLDDAEFQQELQQAEAYLDVAKANLEAAQDLLQSNERELERISQLRDKNLISASELDSAKSDYTTQLSKFKVAKAQLSEKQAAYQVAKIKLSYTKINTIRNVNGANLVVGERFVDEGALLNSNTPIISILDIASMIGVIHVTENDYFKVQIGQNAVVTVDALKDRVFSGEIVRISPLVKEETRAAQIELDIDNPSGMLKPGLFIRVSIQFAFHEKATVIPVSALVKRNEFTSVFVIDPEKELANLVRIETGITQNDWVEIVTPSLKGYVATLGQHLLEDGSNVTVPEKPAKTGKGGLESALKED
jgi:RND family efflux transporter MFP subunit